MEKKFYELHDMLSEKKQDKAEYLKYSIFCERKDLHIYIYF